MEVSSASYIWRIFMAVGSMFSYIQSLGEYVAEKFVNIQTGEIFYDILEAEENGAVDKRAVDIPANNTPMDERLSKQTQNGVRRHQTKCLDAFLQTKRKFIKDGMVYKSGQALVFSRPLNQQRRDIIAAVCTSVDTKVKIRNRWIQDEQSNQLAWGGAVAIFRTSEKATNAFCKLFNYSPAVTDMQLKRLIDMYMEAEINYPKIGIVTTRNQIIGKRSLQLNDVLPLKEELQKLGDVENIQFRKGVSKYGVM